MSAAVQHAPEIATYAERYRANLAALYCADRDLAAQIDAIPFSKIPPLEPTRDGNATVRVVADDGRPIYLHSRHRPLEEAKSLVDKSAKASGAADEVERDEACGDATTFFVSGMGLGYHVSELERRYPRPILIIAEDDLALIKAALCVVDLSKPLRARRIAFFTTADRSRVHRTLRSILTTVMLGIRFVTPAHTKRYHAEFYKQSLGLMRDFVEYARLQVVSLVRNARISCKNAAFNLPAYVKYPGVEVLEKRAAGYPAIVVAAGPSLARNIDQLGGLRDRAVIISVQTVLKKLLARGVPPHFVTSLDFHEISAQFFRGIEDFRDVTLVAESKVTWHVVDHFRGRMHVLQSEFNDQLLREAAPRRGSLRPGSTVAHLAFYLAEHLGCDPIILVGQDLSFTEGLYYPAGMQVERIWGPELNRFQTVEMKQWERIVRARHGLRQLQDVHGRTVYTDEQMFTYAEQFQSDFASTKARVIHATEGGLKLEHTEVMSLREAAERFCTRPLPKDLFAAVAGAQRDGEDARVVETIERRLEELRDTREIATRTEELLTRLEGLLDRPAEFNRVVTEIDELRVRMREHDQMYRLITQVSQLAELRRVHADRAIDDDTPETPETARIRLRRDREYVRSLIEGCAFLEEMLPEALERVRERL